MSEPDVAWHFDGQAFTGWCSRNGQLSAGEVPIQVMVAPPHEFTRGSHGTTEWQVGDLVHHQTFSYGEVLTVSGRDHTLEATIRFEGVGVKHLALHWANLEKIL